MGSRYIPKERRNRLIEEANYQCELCGRKRGQLEIHHIIPFSLTGDDSDDNLIVLCQSCHTRLTPRSKLTKLGQRGDTPIHQAIYIELDESGVDNFRDSFYEVLDLVDKYTGKDSGGNLYTFYQKRGKR